MKLHAVLTQYKFPEEVKDIFSSRGLTSLYPPQAQAIEKGVLEGKSLLMAVPTAAGKTLIAELCMLKAILEEGGRCLYIVPLKALAGEKFEDFKEKYSPLGIKVGTATGDSDTPNEYLNRYQILIATAEKVDSLLRSRVPWLINALKVVVLDEIHFINDGARGPTLEILTARIKQLNQKAQILAMSATIGNAGEIAHWLGAQLVASDWRPIPLKEGVYCGGTIRFHDHANRIVNEQSVDDLGQLSLDTLKGGGQVLIFVNSRRSSQAASRQIGPSVARTLDPEEKKKLSLIAQQVVGSQTDSTKICRNLGAVIRCGVAFHHAGLKPQQRKLIEDHFKNNLIKVICSTPTLAAGVNIPARRTIMRDYKRFESGLGSSHIPVSEYKQCAGRAGRPQFDEYGEAVLIAKTSGEAKALFDRYINAPPEPIISKLGNASALRIHILSSIAGGYVHDINDTFKFLSHTFLAHQKRTPHLLEMVGDIFEFLQDEGFIEKSGFRFLATPFGQATSRLYVDPVSSLILRKGLQTIEAGKSFSTISLLHLICCCPDSPLLKPGKKDGEEIENFASTCQDEFVITDEDLPDLGNFLFYISVIKTTMMLGRWIEEEKEEVMCDNFGIGPGDIYRHTEAVRWLLYAGIVFADLFGQKNLTFLFSDLKNRIVYGIKEELLPLIQLKGIGRIRARHLYNKGFKDPSDLKNAPLDQLAQVSQIGKTLAQDILKQVA